jgi:SIR2-like protein
MSGQPGPRPEDLVPPLPAEIRKAQDQGNLVLFCGAGVSCDAGLPLFRGLVSHIYSTIPGHVPDDRERTALDKGEFDRALHILESKLRNNEVRAATIDRLSRSPSTLAVHEALLQIARQADGVHLVTTNFDNLFPEALEALGDKSIEIDAAPKLPVPKSKKWNSVVHLHGLINQRTDPDGRRLVLTSADFGASYLTERWASRFVSELIRRYTILFVGYQADDVVMRYILDALDADMRLDEQVYRPFAFASYNPDASKDEQLGSWRAKGIQPIPYPKIGNSHSVLTACLTGWASDWKDGRQGKASIVESLASSQPDLPPPEKERLLWALADQSGVPARQLTVKADGESLPRAPVSWIDEFFKAGLLSACFNGGEGGPKDHFFGPRDTEWGLPISDRDLQFLFWLRAHLPSTEFYRKVTAMGGALHPHVALELRREVVGRAITTGKADLSTAWLVATSPAIVLPPSQVMSFHASHTTCKAIEKWKGSSWIDNDIEYALTPYLRIQDPEDKWRFEAAYGLSESDRTTKDYISAELVLRCGDGVDMIVKALMGKEELLARLARRANALLGRALDLYQITSSIDPSTFAVPRIRGLSVNSQRRTWGVLIDLVWSAFLACQTHDPAEAAAAYDAWTRSPHTAHRRLKIKAAAEATILTPAQRLNALIGQP